MGEEDKKVVGANLIFSFYNNVAVLKALAAQQLNILSSLDAKYKTFVKDANEQGLLSQEEALQLKSVNDQIRGHLQIIFYDYRALADELKESPEQLEKISKLWNTIKFNQHLEKVDVDTLVNEYNRVLVKKVALKFFDVATETVNKFV